MKPRATSAKASQAKSVRRGRTFTGCWNCRARKVKCDEISPQCTPCTKHGTPCSGYESRLVWVTADQKTYAPNGRRFLPCETTWNRTKTLSSDDIDYFISICDSAKYIKGATIQWSPESRIPFGAFPSSCLRDVHHLPAPTTLPRSLIYGTPLKDQEAFLFQHYVHHVAFLMMPYEDQRNPWKSSYPAAALHYLSNNHSSLYKALLAQAAYNLAYLDCGRDRMLRLAGGYYASAMRDLRIGILDHYKDYGTLIASIMTLVMVEIYSGNSNTWRTHLGSAWIFSKQLQPLKPWNLSAFAESSTQSLCIIKIVSDSSKKLEELELEDNNLCQEPLISAMSSYPSFGLTIGASRLLMTCINDIHGLARSVRFGRETGDTTTNILQNLDQCRQKASLDWQSGPDTETPQNPKHKSMTYYHESAFIAATYIYLYRSVNNSPPQAVQKYVTEVFHNIGAFFSVDEGNFSLWPAFIAAVEAYDEADLLSARAWLNNASKVGMGNRLKIQAVVQEVWRQREAIAIQSQKDVGSVVVDWRDVMADLKLDIVLV